ncbi:MAG: DUF4034 domain-containing protein [Verrucomicrobiota bacterium]
MKSRSLPLLILGILLAASHAGAASPTPRAAEVSKYDAEKALQGAPIEKGSWRKWSNECAAWHRARLRAAYERAGTKNSKWNEPMLTLLDQVALQRGGMDVADPKQMEDLVRQIERLGCTDPLFRYLRLRYGALSMKQEEVVPALRAASQALRDSDYDSLEKFWATYRTASQLRGESGPKTPPDVIALYRAAVDQLTNAFGNRELPAGEVVTTSEEILSALKFNPVEYRAAWDKLVPLMLQHWSKNPQVLLTIGWGHIDRAWMARGSGYADKVTQEGWKIYAAELDKAEIYLTNSWALGTLSATARQMMRLELGQGEGRERLELWFQRAMDLDPGDYEACADKLWYLMPRWYGDHNKMLKFGRSCLNHPSWNGRVPLALMRARELIAEDLPKEDRPAYWRKKEVWSDVRSSFERFFELNPNNVSWRHNYAWFAWAAQDWDELNRQIPLLGEINYAYFGGKDQYDRMLAEARARGGAGPK